MLEIIDRGLIERIVAEAYELLMSPGVQVGSAAAVELLRSAGVAVENGVAHIPQAIAERALNSVPKEFFLYDRRGRATVHYGGCDVHFDPGSSCLNILDPESLLPRLATAEDLVRLVKVAEMLPHAAQSTAMVASDVPKDVGDLYRLFLVLWYSEKPVITGAFSAEGLGPMLELLALESVAKDLAGKPRAVFDVCPSPPLNWSEFAAYNLVTLARAGMPAEIVSMPIAGAAAPVTLAGSVVQHAAECISGITIHQLAAPGAPIVWGGAPSILDMRTGTTPVGAIETVMLNAACAQVGKYFGLPTHAYMVASDSKLVDAQAGMESAVSATIGALAGINMISGAGMLDFLACHSIEKLVIDAEAIASAQRLIAGIHAEDASLATTAFAQTGFAGDFLKLKETRALFRREQHFPSSVVDRGTSSLDAVAPSLDTFGRARLRVEELLGAYQRPRLMPEVERELLDFVQRLAAIREMARFPGIDDLAYSTASD